LDGLTTSSNSNKKSFSHTAKGMLGSVSAGLEEEEGPPALKAAAADPWGAFTAAAAEAGGGGEDEVCPPALKAAAADPTGAFTAAAAEAGGNEEPELVAADGCANVVGTDRAAAGAAGEPGAAITGDTMGDSCEGGVDVEVEPAVVISWFSAGSTRSL
jgi:hypothetical protein